MQFKYYDCCLEITEGPQLLVEVRNFMNDTRTLRTLGCSLPDGEAGERRAEVGRLFAQSTAATTLPDGIELEYPGDEATTRALFDFVVFERGCCAQLGFELRFAPPHRVVRLRITGAPEFVLPIRSFAGVSQ